MKYNREEKYTLHEVFYVNMLYCFLCYHQMSQMSSCVLLDTCTYYIIMTDCTYIDDDIDIHIEIHTDNHIDFDNYYDIDIDIDSDLHIDIDIDKNKGTSTLILHA